MTPPSPNEESLGLVPTNRDRDFVPRVSYRDDPDESDHDDDDDHDHDDDHERVLPLHARHETHHASRTSTSTLWQRLVCAARITIVVSIVGTLLVTGKSLFHFGEIRDESGASSEHDVVIPRSPSPRDEIRAVQISNYRAGKALLLHVHITHHAGTTFCDAMKQLGPAPSFACMRDDRDHDGWPPSLDHHRPWTRDETDGNAIALRKVYHFISWEFGILPPTPLKDVDWESPHLVSVILMRDPLERRLAADATVEKYFGEEASRTEEQWWEFAEYEGSVNFVLTRLTPDRCGEKGEEATEACLEEGKELLRRFTYILDVQCLDEGIKALSDELGLPKPHVKKGNVNDALNQMTTRERIGNDEIYDFIVKRNRRDIELYEWSKGLSLVKCSELTSAPVNDDLLPVDDNADGLEIGNVSETEQPTSPPTPAKHPYDDTSKHNAIRAMQIHNYKLGRALLLNVHITHHGGTTVCNAMKQLGHAPEGACNRGDDWPETVPKYRPWGYDETDKNAKALRNVYHFISWEFGIIPPTPLKDVKWESPNLVSFIVMKDPIDRRLSGDATTSKLFGEEADRTEEQWEEFAKYDGSINFMLTRLTPDHCGEEGENATKSCLEQGKELLRRFTFILDIQCLEEGLEALANELGLHMPDVKKGRGRTSVSARERIGNDDIYDFIVERNRLDLELYEWSKSLSLVNCSALEEGDFDDDLNVTDAGDVDQFSDAINYNYTLNATDYSDDKFDSEGDSVFNNQSDSKSTNEESGSEILLASNNITDKDNTNIDDRASIRALQIENYKKGDALLLNIHITHHAGTTFCAAMKHIGNTPEHACNNGDDWPESVTQQRPWEYNETDRNAIELRKVYHFISWEFGRIPRSPLEDVNWESPHLVSVIVMKDPIDRRLSGDGGINRMFGTEEERTEEQWEAFAKYDGSINFMLTRLTPDRCGTAGENTTEECLETGKDLLRRFTYILDVKCLDEGLEALAGELGFSLPYLNKDSGRTQVSARERIGNDELYELILRRNQRDLELYEWSKGLSLVNCSALENENSDSTGNGGGDGFVDENGTDDDIFTSFNETHDFDDEFSAEDYSVYNNETGDEETSALVGEKSSQDIVVVTNNNTDDHRSNNHEDIRLLQIENYKKGNALLLNIHITHHAGTTFCAAMKQIGNTPSNACNGGDDWPETVPQYRPWEYNETDRNAIELRKLYHFISWEFGIIPPIPLKDTNWESPHLVSVIVMKDPIDRRLSGDGTILKKFGKEKYRSEEQWWEFAKYDGSINFMLTRLTPDHCGEDGENATDTCLEEGKDLLRRFTYILDVKCLDEGLEALAGELGFSLPAVRKSSGKTSVSARERIGNDDIYDFIIERNRRDLQLYEWSKGLSLVNCSALEEELFDDDNDNNDINKNDDDFDD